MVCVFVNIIIVLFCVNQLYLPIDEWSCYLFYMFFAFNESTISIPQYQQNRKDMRQDNDSKHVKSNCVMHFLKDNMVGASPISWRLTCW